MVGILGKYLLVLINQTGWQTLENVLIWKHNGNGIGCFTEVHLTLTDNTRSQVGAGQSCCLSRDCTECCGSVVRVLPHCHTAILPSAAALPLLAARSLVRREGGREGGTSSLLTSTVHTSHYTLPTPGNTGHHRRSSGSNTRKQTNNQSSPIGLSQGVVWRLLVWLQVAGYQSCFTQIFKLFCCGTTELWLAVTPWYLSQPICTLLSLIKLLYNLSLFGFGRIIRGSTFRSKYQSVSHLDGFCQIQDSRQSDGVFLFQSDCFLVRELYQRNKTVIVNDWSILLSNHLFVWCSV